MNTDEILQLIDEIMYTKMNKHLSDLQRKVIEGILNHQTYLEIADEYGRSEGHVKDVGYELLQKLSELLEEPVKKSNLKSVLEGKKNFNFSFLENSINNNVIGCINLGDQSQSKNNASLNQSENISGLSEQTISKVRKLKSRGLENEEISEILEISLELIQEINKIS